MLVCSVLSIFVSIPVLLVPYLFPKMAKKQYVIVVFYISLSSLIAAAATSVGMPLDGSNECYFQAVVQNLFTVASAFWTVVLSVQLYFIVELGSVFVITYEIHLIIWLLSAFVTFIPLSEVAYGARDGMGWCFLVEIEGSPGRLSMSVWYWLSYYLWMWISILTYICFSVLTQRSADQMRCDDSVKIKKAVDPLKSAFRVLQPYPFLLILSWSITTIADTFEVSIGDSTIPSGLASVGNALGCLQGFLISSYYLWSNTEVQNGYHLLLLGVPRRRKSQVSATRVAVCGEERGATLSTDLHQSVASEYLEEEGDDGFDENGGEGETVKYANIRNFHTILRHTYLQGKV